MALLRPADEREAPAVTCLSVATDDLLGDDQGVLPPRNAQGNARHDLLFRTDIETPTHLTNHIALECEQTRRSCNVAAASMRKNPAAHRASVRFYENYLNVRLNGLFTYVTEIRLWMTADVIEALDSQLLKSIKSRMRIVRDLEDIRNDVVERLSFELMECVHEQV